MNKTKDSPENIWKCGKCQGELTLGPVKITYLGNEFTVNVLNCLTCGLVLITEELALGKMIEVEQNLEDK